MEWLYMLSTGITAGVASGFFGIGGGAVLVPALVLLFRFPQQTANGTSLVALLLPVGLLGVVQYYKAGQITNENIKLGLIIAVGIFLGTYLGSKFAIGVPSKLLTKAFSVFLAGVAIKMWFAE